MKLRLPWINRRYADEDSFLEREAASMKNPSGLRKNDSIIRAVLVNDPLHQLAEDGSVPLIQVEQILDSGLIERGFISPSLFRTMVRKFDTLHRSIPRVYEKDLRGERI